MIEKDLVSGDRRIISLNDPETGISLAVIGQPGLVQIAPYFNDQPMIAFDLSPEGARKLEAALKGAIDHAGK